MAFKTIKIKSFGEYSQEELNAAEAITPGHLLERTSGSKWQKHSTAEGNVVPKVFAIEDALQGNGITDAYAVNAPVRGWFVRPGDEVYALLKDGETVVIGDKLESAGDGTLQKHVADVESGGEAIVQEAIVGEAMEALDVSGSSGADTTYRLRVKI